MLKNPPTPTDASATIQELEEGDVIHLRQYESPLAVTFLGDADGGPNAYVGLEFTNQNRKADKRLIRNQATGRVYLQAGKYDRGEVEEIEVVRRASDQEGEADE